MKRFILPFLALLLYALPASAQIGTCSTNNDDNPPYIPGNDPMISINEVDVTAANPPNTLCIGDSSDPDSDTNGCGTFRFTNLPTGNTDCPSYFCFTPKQGCGNALGNVCVWIEGIDQTTWDNVGTIDGTNGFTRICVASNPEISTFDVTVCRPGNGPVSIADLEIFLPPAMSIPEEDSLCTVTFPTSLDLTTLEPAGFMGGVWSSTDIAINDPANIPIDNSLMDGDCLSFDYAYDASFVINGSDEPDDGINIDVPCIIRDTIKYTVSDDCCFCVNDPTFTGVDNVTIPVCNPDLTIDADGDGIPDFIDMILGGVTATADQYCMLSPISYTDTAPVTDDCTTSLVRTYTTATDCAGLSSTFSQTISWTTDLTPPTFANCTNGDAGTIDLGCNISPPAAADAIAAVGAPSDLCDLGAGNVTAAMMDTNTAGCVTTENWIVNIVDACGNIGSCSVAFSYTTDTDVPTFTNCTSGTLTSGVIDLGCQATPPTTEDVLAAVGIPIDGCGVALDAPRAILNNTTVVGCATTEIWTAIVIDDCGNTGTCEVTFTYTDDAVGPTFANCTNGSLSSGVIDLGCNPTVPTAADALAAVGTPSDNCGLGANPATVVLGSADIVGCVATEVWTVSIDDACGNTGSCEVTFSYTTDNEAPTFANCTNGDAGTIDLGCNNPPDEAAALAAVGTPTDNCGLAAPAVVVMETTNTTGCVVTEVWTVTVNDVCGTTGTCSVTFTYTVDPEAPTFVNCVNGDAGTIDLGCNNTPDEAAALAAVGAPADNCGLGPVAASASMISVNTVGCMVTEVWTATIEDACGTTGSCTVSFTYITDTELPTIVCPTVAPLEGCDESVITAATTGLDFSTTPVDITGVVVSDLIITDNCGAGGIVSVFYQDNITDGDCPNPITVVERTFTVTDQCGQENSCVQTIDVVRSDPALIIIKQAVDGTDVQVVNPGGTATFEVIVTNSGSIDLINVIVDDPLSASCNNNVGNLAAGASVTYTCTVPGIQAPFINTATATADGADCACAQAVASDDSEVVLAMPGLAIDKHAADGSDSQEVSPGGTASYEIVVTNTGDVPLENVVVSDPNSPDCDNAIGNMAAGEVVVYTCSFPNVQTGFINTAMVTGDPLGGGDPVMDVDDSQVMILMPSVSIVKRATNGMDTQDVNPGGTASFEIIVMNTGDVALENIVVTDPQLSDCDTVITLLNIGESVSYTCSMDDVNAGFVNTVSVTADPVGGGDPVSDDDDSEVLLTNPGVEIIKTALDGSEDQLVNPGGTASFEITVTNTGDVALENIIINDPLTPDCGNVINMLGVGVATTYICTLDNVQSGFLNVIDVVADPVGGGTPVMDNDDANVTLANPAIEIIKTAADGSDEQMVNPGGTATFEITVTNTGDVLLENIVIADVETPNCNNTIASLNIGESVIYTCTLDNVQGGFTNIATAIADPVGGGDPVGDDDDSEVLYNNPEVTIVKTGLGGIDPQLVNPGGTATFEITVSNTGDVDLENIVVTDPNTIGCDTEIPFLAIGASTSYTCTQENVQADFVNVVNVVADPVGGGTPVSDTDDAETLLTNPSIAILKTGLGGVEPQLVNPGGTATFEITVTNTGDVALENIVVSDPLSLGCETVIPLLAVGASTSYTCTEDDVQEYFDNLVDVIATPVGGGDPVDNTDNSEVELTNPAIEIIKMAADGTDTQLINPGTSASFIITITNTGDVDLENLVVGDELSPDCATTFAALAIGASESYTCSINNVQEEFTNIVDVIADPVGGGYSVDAMDESDVTLTNPSIAIVKSGIGGMEPLEVTDENPGVIFEITVTNDGDVDLENIVITDSVTPACDTTFVSLAVGESITYTCPQDDIPGDFINTANVTADPVGGGDPVTDTDSAIVLDCSSVTVICNDLVQVSLDENCQAIIVASMLLDGEEIADDFYAVEITDEDGNMLGNELGPDQVGDTLTYMVFKPCSTIHNPCWGMIIVEDKLAPEITCPDDVTAGFICSDLDEIYTPEITVLQDSLILPTGNPIATDNCGEITVTYSDVLEEGGMCGDDIITRTFTVVDPSGNSATCMQSIAIGRPVLDSIVFPEVLVLACDAVADLDATTLYDAGYDAFPLIPSFFGVHPINDTYCNLGASYSDSPEISICGSSYKIIRTWTVLDWCTSESSIHNQIIKLEDSEAPTFSCPDYEPVIANTANGQCEAIVTILPILDFEDNCSELAETTVEITAADGSISSHNIGDEVLLAAGTYTLTYFVTDGCDNNAIPCTTTVTILDDTPPVAVCDEHTTVSVNIDGSAIICTQTFDDGSYDNCSDVVIRVKRMDAPTNVDFAECLEFDCSDIGDIVMVRMRVYDFVSEEAFDDDDEESRYNECMIEVEVQDKLAPNIVCPADKTLECHANYVEFPELSNNSNEGLATFYNGELVGYYAGASDNCGATITIEDEGEIDNCGEGTIARTWAVTDDGNLTVTCVQTISLINSEPFVSGDISWPADHTSYCTIGAGTNPENLPAGHNYPQITEGACDLVVVTHEDQYLYVVEDACYKILRKWTVIDWCQFKLHGDITYEGYWEYTQIIKVIDTVVPEILSSCEDIEACNFEEDCSASYVELVLDATDICSNDLNYTYNIDAFDDGVADNGSAFNGDSNDASGDFPVGTHHIYWSVEDGCGNISYCDYTFTVKDCKKPTPVLINGLSTVVMPSSLGITMWAVDFDAPNSGSFDNCTDAEDLTFKARIVAPGNTLLSTLTEVLALDNDISFTCDNLGFNEVEVFVIDEAGNWDAAITYIELQDPNGVCNNNELADVSGNIYNESDEMVSTVNVEMNIETTAIPAFLTSNDGYFHFSAAMFENYVIVPEKDVDPLNGVTTFDLVLISKHILGLNLLDSPYKIIAADANASGAVTTFDLVTLRRLILNIDTEFVNNTSWRFIEASYNFVDPANPFATVFPEVIAINDLDDNMENNDFVAVKIGDVNNSAIPTSFVGTQQRTFDDNLVLNLKDQELVAGGTYNIDFTASDFNNVLGYQFTLNFDVNVLEFVAVKTGSLNNLSESNFGLSLLDKGAITTSWNESKAASLKDDAVLFSLQFVAKAKEQLSELISVSSQFTHAEAYTTNEELAIALAFVSETGTTVSENGFELFQNIPNPVLNNTMIGFQLPEATTATLRVFDIAGKEIKVIEGNFAKGYNEIKINRSELNAAGVLYYELSTNTDKAIMKMILVD